MSCAEGDTGLIFEGARRIAERDRQREVDGFPRKIRFGRIVRPGKGGTKHLGLPVFHEVKEAKAETGANARSYST